MPRQFLPTFRGLFTPRSAEPPPPPAETKDLLAGGVYTSMSYAGVTNVWGTPGRADGWDLERVIIEGYERSIWTFKSVEAISKHASTLPVQIGRGGDEREFEEVLEDHPLLKLLNQQANPLETGDVFKKRLSAQLLLSKKGVFIEKTKSRGGVLVRLDLLPPDRVQIIPDDENAAYVKHFEFTDYNGHIRELKPESVIWIRDPHPTDPFCGVTPLEAAGLSVDLDVKARTYNISFIDRDARPGGILGIDLEGVDQREVERIQKRLAPGAHHAGELALVGTGPGGITYVDTSARPREMAYEVLSSTAKNEILSAFGVYESVIGNASERTFNNADREEWNFWAHTELPHLNLIASAFDPDLSDDWVIRFDTSRVQALEFPRRQAREEARKEFEAGLLTIDEYRVLAGRRPFNTAQTRALWISPQKAPVPANDQDAAALGLAPEPGAGGATPPGALPPGGEDQSAAAAVAEARGLEPTPTAADDVALARGQAPLALPSGPAGTAADVVAAARAQVTEEAIPGDAADDVARARASVTQPETGPAAEDVETARAQLETKTLPDSGFEVTDADFDALAMAVQAALAALLARQAGVIAARLRAPKIRKGTRFWEPDDENDTRGGDASIDEDRVVHASRWAEETTNTIAPILQPAAAATARRLGQALAGVATVPPAAVAPALVTAMYAGEAMTSLLDDLAEELRSLQAQPDDITLEDLEHAVTRFYERAGTEWAARVAETCAVSTINGAADAAAESAGPGVVRTWITRQDDRVRPAHRALQGKTLPVGTLYEINGAQLRYPGDPFAPIALTINCRCRLHYDTDPQE
ncbi:portal and MuF-like fusion protein [Streptomyces phage Gilgamesh]|uniref:Portal and MuF-like fusion protein n=1 Tax=Streptomyces phage Gilgamesh TaxID=2599890 RepID=A0A5J6TS97_9CAUD|nr:portal and MuF-like fusion protein [Streptomyces phage Gilgamesh]QFG13238.1 portal and MuF-like fusion protein [Streptomyces phage Gilgamesh]